MLSASLMDKATIQAIDDPGGTLYILRRAGHPPVTAPWPHPLLELAPDAVRVPAVLGPNEPTEGIPVLVGFNDNWAPTYEERVTAASKLKFRSRERRLKSWREMRPKLYLRTGRKRNFSARVDEATLREVYRRHWFGYESIRSIAREHWREWGYANPESAAGSVWESLKAYGLKLHSRSEMTARANRARTKRLPGEDKNEYKKRLRRERGEVRGVQCAGMKESWGGRRRRCKNAALKGSRYCYGHDPAFKEEREEHFRKMREKSPLRL
jgi:hypothetical protein